MTNNILSLNFDIGSTNDVIINVDGKRNYTVSGDTILTLELTKGSHHLKCWRISKYTKRNCYFNIINPIVFLSFALFKVESKLLFAYDAETPIIDIDIDLTKDVAMGVKLNIQCFNNNYNNMYYIFDISAPHTLKFKIARNDIPPVYILRWRLIHIIPPITTALFMWLLTFLIPGNLFLHCGICAFYSFLASIHIYSVMKAKSVISMLKS